VNESLSFISDLVSCGVGTVLNKQYKQYIICNNSFLKVFTIFFPVISPQFYSYSSTPVGWQLIWPACAGLRVYDKTTNNPSKSKQAICMRCSAPERSN